MQRELSRMLDRWYGEHLPRLLQLEERLGQMQPRGQDASAVLALLDEADAIHREAWQIHFTIAPLMLLSMQLLREMHAELFEDDGEGALTMMAGTVSGSINATFGLADLADRARELGLDEALIAMEDEALLSTLGETEAGRAFLAHLDAYLADYGLRQDMFDFGTPTWRENPAVALASIRRYLETGYDPRAEHAEIARAAEAAFEAARDRLEAYPAAVWERFEGIVQLGRQGAFLQEEHNFYIDQRMLSTLRLFYVEVGAALVDRGLLDEANDVFMLYIDEIRALVSEPEPGSRAEATRALVARRREELAEAATLTPPSTIGTAVDAPPPPDTPMSRSLTAFFGSRLVPESEAGQVTGTPGSRGVATGTALVARTLDDARALRPGQVLVAITTMPPWTPLFGIAAAVVTETGGPLSHCAVVAREYGIPAVVGARGATSAIRTGQQVTVDGTAGVVTIQS
jgi:pyruvate,water dikinase